MSRSSAKARPEQDAALAACVLAVDPSGLGGVVVHATYGAAGEWFPKLLRELLPAGAPFRRIPCQIADSRLLGGLDLAMTLHAGIPSFERGLLAEADGGCIVLPMAERVSAAMAARLCAVLDSLEVVAERDGFAARNPARIAVVALDEGVSDDERVPPALLDRLALHVDLEQVRSVDDLEPPFSAARVQAARAILSDVLADEVMLAAFCHAAIAIGIASVRAPMLAMRAARAHAVLCGRKRLDDSDAIVASRLVLAPRATVLPAAGRDASSEDEHDRPDDSNAGAAGPERAEDEAPSTGGGELGEIVLEAVRASIPAHLLAQLQAPLAARRLPAASGGSGPSAHSALRGRPIGTKRGDPRTGARLDVVETLRSAAPWQKFRRAESSGRRIEVRRDDFRLVRFKRRSESATIFVVDASGSSALHRLAEAKGAVELLLADCYVRRDQVALIAFRGRGADLVLPPTRSLARAKRSLAALPGGGGTPVAAALDAAGGLADGLRRKGLAATVVLLTDGRANVARDGAGGRQRAEADALASARRCRQLRLAALLVDTSPTPSPAAERLAAEMGARYLPLPRADAAAIARAVADSAGANG